jgi:hypothetical protein
VQCGGDNGRVSIYYDFAAPVTIGLNVFLYNSAGQNVVINYTTSGLPPPPIPGSPLPGISQIG